MNSLRLSVCLSVLGALLVTALVVVFTSSMWLSKHVEISFTAKQNAPVRYSVYYATDESQKMHSSRRISVVAEEGKEKITIKYPEDKLHRVRLDYDVVGTEQANVVIKDFCVYGDKEYHVSDFTQECKFNVPQQHVVEKGRLKVELKKGADTFFLVKKTLDIRSSYHVSWLLMIGCSVVVFLLSFLLIRDCLNSHNEEVKSKGSFLTHVAGLRALAILLVVWFHFAGSPANEDAIRSLPHGFFGVDVFMVIMGYFLIKGFCKKETIAAVKFTQSKLARLLPALLVVIIVTMLLGLAIFDCNDIESMAKIGLATLYGWSNEELRLTTDYFADDASMNPFLHTWYISVTLQLFALFYICYRMLKPFGGRTVLWILAGVGIASCIYSQQESIIRVLDVFGVSGMMAESPPSYYSTLARVWELLAGGSIMLLPHVTMRWKRSVYTFVGLLLILLPAFTISPTAWTTALLVVPGTMLVVRYGGENMLSFLLANRFAQWLGKISYSLYLVHMPVLVLYKGWVFHTPGALELLSLFVASLVIGWGVWKFVENRQFSWWSIGAAWGFAFVLCLSALLTNGFKDYIHKESNRYSIPYYHTYKWVPESEISVTHDFDADVLVPAGASRKKEFRGKAPIMRIGNRKVKPSFVVIGDSHMYQIGIGLDSICRGSDVSGVMVDTIIMPFWNRKFVNPASVYYKYDREKGEALMRWLGAHPELRTVVVGQYWMRFLQLEHDWDNNPVSKHEEEFIQFLQKLRELGKTVVLVEPTPKFKSAKILPYVRWMKRRGMPVNILPDEFIHTTAEYEEDYKIAIHALDRAENEGLCKVMRVRNIFYEKGQCSNVWNNMVICGDGHHMTIPSAQMMMRELKAHILPILQASVE